MSSDDLVFISPRSNALLAKSQVRSGDILTVRTGYPGASAVVPDHFEGANCIDVIISRSKAGVSAEYLANWINSSFGKEQVLRKQGGLAQQHFNIGELRALCVASPNDEEQKKILWILLAQGTQEQSQREHLKHLRQLKAGLMQDLLTGRVRVPVPEITTA